MITASRVALLGLLLATVALAAPKPDDSGLPAGARARLGSRLLRHGDKIFFVGFTPDGKRLVTASHDHSIRVWDAVSGQQLHRLPLPEGDGLNAMPNMGIMIVGMPMMAAARVALAPDGKHVAALAQGKLLVWELEKGAKVQEWKGASGSDIAFADDKSIVTLAPGGTTATWNLATGKSEGGGGGGWLNLLVGGGSDGFLSPDAKFVAHFQVNNPQNPEMSVTIKELATGKDRHTIKLGLGGAPIAGFSPDGQLFAWMSFDSSLHVLDVAAGKELEPWKNQRASATITGLRFSSNGKLLALADDDGAIRLCETQTAKVLRRIGMREGQQPQAPAMVIVQTSMGSSTQKSGLAFSPDDKKLAASFGAAGLRLFDVETGEEQSVSSGGHRATVTRVAVAADGKTLTSLDRGGECLLWNLGTNQQERSIRLDALAELSADGRWAVSVRGAEVQVIDTRTGKPAGKIDAGQSMLRALAISADGKLVATRGSGVDIWEVASGRQLRSVGAPAAAGNGLQPVFVNLSGVLTPALTFSPDGRFLAGAGGEQQLCVWDVHSGESVAEFRLPKDQIVQQLVFTPNSACLVLLGEDGKVADVYEIATGTKRCHLGQPAERKQQVEAAVMINGMTFSLFGNDQDKPAAAVSPDGRLLALGDGKGAIRLWDLITGTEWKKFEGHEGGISSLAFSPDGRTLLSGSKDTMIVVWELTPREPKVAGASLETRKLDELWSALANEEAAQAWTAQVELSRHPKQAADLVKNKLRPVAAPDDKEIARLIAALDNQEFEVRDKARAKLASIGELAAPALKMALAGDVTVEVRQQLERLITQAGRVASSGDRLHTSRALELLELADSPESREVLRTLAKGAEGAGLTRAAKAALDRLGAR